MEGSIQELGLTTTCMVKASTPGKTAVVTRACTSTTKSTDMGSINGQMVANTKDSGTRASSMVMGCIRRIQMTNMVIICKKRPIIMIQRMTGIWSSMGSGRWERESSGL